MEKFKKCCRTTEGHYMFTFSRYVHRIAFSVKVSRFTVQKLDRQIGSEKFYQCDTFISLSDINLLASCFDVVANTFTSVFLSLI